MKTIIYRTLKNTQKTEVAVSSFLSADQIEQYLYSLIQVGDKVMTWEFKQINNEKTN